MHSDDDDDEDDGDGDVSGLPRTQLGGGVAGLAVPSCIHSWLRWEPAGSSLPTSLYHRQHSQHHDLTSKSIV